MSFILDLLPNKFSSHIFLAAFFRCLTLDHHHHLFSFSYFSFIYLLHSEVFFYVKFSFITMSAISADYAILLLEMPRIRCLFWKRSTFQNRNTQCDSMKNFNSIHQMNPVIFFFAFICVLLQIPFFFSFFFLHSEVFF